MNNIYHKYDINEQKKTILDKIFWHGSKNVMGGKLIGTTDTDYFYFKCPTCGNILVPTDFFFVDTKDTDHYKAKNKAIKKAIPQVKQLGILKIELYCRKCKKKDYTKISSLGWLGGKFDNLVERNRVLG